MAGVNSLPTTFWSSIRTGTLESLFVTPVRPLTLVIGMMAYGLLWAAAEAAVLFAVGLALGVHLVGAQAVMATAILGLITLAYIPFGLFGAALLLLFRTTGPLLNGVVVGSAVLGGIYYPSHVIPSWIGQLAAVVPLTYGLRALRQLFLAGQPIAAVAGDLAVLAAFATVLLAVSWSAFAAALRHAKRAGSQPILKAPMGKSAVVKNGPSLETTAVQSSQQVSCDLGEEIVVLSLKNGAYYGLDPVAAQIWTLLAEPRTVTSIRDTLLSEYDQVDADQCTRDVMGLIRQLEKWELLEIDPAER